jgi:protein rogdi
LEVLKQLHDILVECAHRFPVPLYGNEGKKVDKFVLTSAPENLKVTVTLTGDSITHSVSHVIRFVLNLRLARGS